jgi:hypothetical protein
VDPYWDDVISLLNFHEAVTFPTYPAGYPSGVSMPVTEDYKGVGWTLFGWEHIQASTEPGVGLTLPIYQSVPGHIFSNAVLQASGLPAFGAGPFTIELGHNSIDAAESGGVGGSYEANEAIYMVSAVSSPGTTSYAPASPGDWGLSSHGNGTGSFLAFNVFDSGPIDRVVGGLTLVPYPLVQDNEIAITRDASGVMRMYVNGVLEATQTVHIGTTVMGNAVTLGGVANGAQYLPNNFGYGIFKRWRITDRVARYTGSSYVVPAFYPTS